MCVCVCVGGGGGGGQHKIKKKNIFQWLNPIINFAIINTIVNVFALAKTTRNVHVNVL